MSSLNHVNRFFDKHIYSNISKVAVCPLSWAFESSAEQGPWRPDFIKMLIGLCLSPILFPMFVETFSLAISLALVAVLVHALSAGVAAIIDACAPTNPLTINQ